MLLLWCKEEINLIILTGRQCDKLTGYRKEGEKEVEKYQSKFHRLEYGILATLLSWR